MAKGRKPQDPAIKQAYINSQYPKVLAMVEDGWNISKALEIFGVDRQTFYKNITNDQKIELQMAKTAHAKYEYGRARY